MMVKLKIAAGFRYYVPNVSDLVQGVEYDVPEGSTLGQLLVEVAGFPEEIITIPLVNGHRVDRDRVLEENDQVYLVQPAMGG
jgi:sulfur carrier protein ThiS